MNKPQSDDPLFKATNSYLESLQTHLEQEKQNFSEAIKTKFFKPANNHPRYESIIVDVNQNALEKMDEAINYIRSTRTKLDKLANKAEQDVWKNLPKE